MINVAIAGISGRMGRALLEAVMASADMRLHAALDRVGSPALENDAGALAGTTLGIKVSADASAASAGASAGMARGPHGASRNARAKRRGRNLRGHLPQREHLVENVP